MVAIAVVFFKLCSNVVAVVISVVSYEVLADVVCGEVGVAVVFSSFGDTQLCSLFRNTWLSQAMISDSSFGLVASTVTTTR